MRSFDVAHVREQGQNMLLFPLDGSFQHRSSSDQNATLNELQYRANRAGLAGSAALIWESGGRTMTLGPKPWAGFLRSINLHFVLRNVNREISW